MDIDDLRLKLRKGVSAAFLDEYAVIGDVHLGFEKELAVYGYSVADTTDLIASKIIGLGSEKLVMLGDIRSEYTAITPDEGGVLTRFFGRLSANFKEIVITKGNHDGGLEKVTGRFDNVRLVSEFSYKKTGFLHGHKLPSKALVASVDTLCFGHLHPAVVTRDSNGVTYKKDCWILCDMKLPADRYKDSAVMYGVAFPKFSPFIGSTDNIKYIGFMRYASRIKRITTDLLVV